MKDRLKPDKIASVVSRLSFDREVEVTTKLESEAGNAVLVRVLEDSRQDIELETGRLSPLLAGNVVIGALGRRRALRGICRERAEPDSTGGQGCRSESGRVDRRVPGYGGGERACGVRSHRNARDRR